MKRSTVPASHTSDSEVIDKLAAVFLTLPQAKTYITLEPSQCDERVTPVVIKQCYELLSRVLVCFRRRPVKEALIHRAWKRYRVLADRSRNDGWCVDEAQKLHLTWKWIWASYKRSPTKHKSHEIKKLKDFFAGTDDAVSDHYRSEVEADDEVSVNVVAEDSNVIDVFSEDDEGGCYSDDGADSDDGAESDDGADKSRQSPKSQRVLKPQTSLVSVASSEAPSCSDRPVRPAALDPSAQGKYDRQGHRDHVKVLRAMVKKPAAMQKAAALLKRPASILKPKCYRLRGKQKVVCLYRPAEFTDAFVITPDEIKLVRIVCGKLGIAISDAPGGSLSTKVFKMYQKNRWLWQVRVLVHGEVSHVFQCTQGTFKENVEMAVTLLRYAAYHGVAKDGLEKLKTKLAKMSCETGGLSFRPID